MLFAFGVYFTYFEMVPRENLSPWRWAALSRGYLLLALMCAVAATGAGVLATVGHEAEVLDGSVRRVLAGSLAASYLVLVGLSRAPVYPDVGAGRPGTENALWASIVGSTAIALFATTWTSLQVLVVLSITASVPWVVGVNAWRRTTRDQPMQAERPTQG